MLRFLTNRTATDRGLQPYPQNDEIACGEHDGSGKQHHNKQVGLVPKGMQGHIDYYLFQEVEKAKHIPNTSSRKSPPVGPTKALRTINMQVYYNVPL